MEGEGKKKGVRLFERIGKFEELTFVIPENPGPKIFGRTPLIGVVRRALDLPVLRDEIEVPPIVEIPPVLTPMIERIRRR